MIPDPSNPAGRTRHYWSKDRKEAKKLYSEGIVHLAAEHAAKTPANSSYSPAESWSLVDLAQHYYEHKKQDGKGASFLGAIKRYLARFFRWLKAQDKAKYDPARLKPAELTTVLLEGYRSLLAQDTAKGLREANHYIEHIRALLNWGTENHGLRHPPLGVMRPFPKSAKAGHGRTFDRKPLTLDVVEKLFAAADPIDECYLWLGLNFGFGQADLASLKLTDIDLDKGTLSNQRQKTGAQRDYALWPETIAALRIYLESHRGKPRDEATAMLFFVGRKGLPVVWEVVNEKTGKVKRSDSVRNRWDKLCKRAGVGLPLGSGFYNLRNPYATMIGEQSSDLHEVQATMGHLTMQQQETYRHDREMKAKAAQGRLHETLRARLPNLMHGRNGQPSGEAT